MPTDIIFRNILESMSDGVMTIDLDGKILTLNGAAEIILAMKADDVLQKSFGAVFLAREENDQFNQTILTAVYDSDTIHNKIVPWHIGEKVLTLSVTTSFLSTSEAGEKKDVAVIVVFNDITEVESLREELKENHRALQKSYVEMEEANTNLNAALKKVQLVRIVATAFVIILFVSIGLITWLQSGFSSKKTGPEMAGKADGATGRTHTVVLQPLTDSIALKGTLKPIQVVNITSPFGGMVKEKLFEYGQSVTKGQLLLKLDRDETEMKYRDAKTAFIEAKEKVKELDNWSDSNEMAKAHQSLTRSKLTLDGHHKTFQETERLFKKEIVPATEYANAKQQFTTAKMDYDASVRELEVVKAKGEGENRIIAGLKMENARQKLQDLENQLGHSDVMAPVSGTVLLPDVAGGDNDKKSKIADRGVTFSQGDILLSIGNTEGLSMTAEIDEMDVLKVKKDMEVRISGDAFREIISGRVIHISSQAVKSEMRKKTASFEVFVAIENVPVSLREKLRLGMSANMEIMILNKPGAIMLPIQAVHLERKERWVSLRENGATTTKKITVETGITTIDAVEITKGLKTGDEVIF